MDQEKEKKIIGRDTFISMPEIGLDDIPCKVDTGAYGCSINATCEEVSDNRLKVVIEVYPGRKATHEFDDFEKKKVKSSSGEMYTRYKVKTPIEIEGIKIRATFTFSDRTNLIYPALIGRKVLSSRFIVDPQISVMDKKDLAKKRNITVKLEELDEK